NGEALAFSQSSFESHIFFSQPAVFDRNRDLAGEYLQHRSNVFGQTPGRRVDQQHAGNFFVATKRIGDRESVSLEQRIAFNRRPTVTAGSIENVPYPG